jgi:hypothetical protein
MISVMKKFVLLVILIFLAVPISAQAHPGNTDKYGCHTCRTNCKKWGLKQNEHHCHKAKKLPQPKKSIQSKKLL